MSDVWNRENFESSITRTCFSATPYDEGWDGNARLNIDGSVLQSDAQMRRLLEMELEIRPVPVWAHDIARQIEKMAPCGWCFPQFVEAACKNMGARDPAAATPLGCYTAGPRRLQLMAHYAVCLDGWIKQASREDVAAEVIQSASDGRDWRSIVDRMHSALGDPNPTKTLLSRRLLARLRFWLRAPYGPAKAGDNLRLGYFYTHSMGRHGGWDYFSFERYDPDVVDLEERMRDGVGNAGRWLELIHCTWPCAPKAFRYLERLIAGIGRVAEGNRSPPTELGDDLPTGILQIEGTYLSTEASRSLYGTAISALAGFIHDPILAGDPDRSNIDACFRNHLAGLLGKLTAEKRWLAALLMKKITLFQKGFRSFHFTRNSEHVL